MLRIKNIINEAKEIKSFVFEHNLDAKPGQFVILWIPRVDEKPFGVSYQDKNKFAITVSAVGPFSKKMHKLKVGDLVGIKGPYGNYYDFDNVKRIALVAGGYGAAPLAFLADEAIKKKIKVDFIIGAKTKEYLLYLKRFENSKVNMHIATDDGSYGEKGFTTDLLKSLLKKKKIDKIYACGPEIMMKFVLQLANANNIPAEFSLERYMKCGGGLCGQCCVDPTGWRVCKEGPVFNKEQIEQIKEFCNYKRTKSGKKVKL
jgi:dihydroorotate dehydrogenase electron transfer subunit